MASDEIALSAVLYWFSKLGLSIAFEQVDGGWRAVIVPKEPKRLDFTLHGKGRTKLEAAEDAWRRWESGERPVITTLRLRQVTETNIAMPLGRSKSQRLGQAIETDHAMPIKAVGGSATAPSVPVPSGGARAGGLAPTESIEVPEPVVKKLTEYGWAILFGQESDGRVRGYLCDLKTLGIIKSEVGDDLQDSFLSLGIDLTAPSEEGRKGRADNSGDPRGDET